MFEASRGGDEADRLLTIGDVAAVLHISVRTTRRLLAEGSLPQSIQLAGRRRLPRWRQSDIQNLIRRPAHAST
jgi:excisionase family DNA binding protein